METICIYIKLGNKHNYNKCSLKLQLENKKDTVLIQLAFYSMRTENGYYFERSN
jgi:hypothetical protein